MREFGCGVTSRHARRSCRNRGGLLRKQKACGLWQMRCIANNRQQTPPTAMRSRMLPLSSETSLDQWEFLPLAEQWEHRPSVGRWERMAVRPTRRTPRSRRRPRLLNSPSSTGASSSNRTPSAPERHLAIATPSTRQLSRSRSISSSAALVAISLTT